ncbi:uncharacterized protein LOC113519703 [Galleria mellonella]|uniref:Uncharacterized protein LOC113519703 n=1 Tax=Galleria mellonella TaxID=7137 RepID=A0A6J1X413_GALME|nr:uncharacterized protein LOC113519703 [Galleria mellonella]
MMRCKIVLVITAFGLLNGCAAELVQDGRCEDIAGISWDLEQFSENFWTVTRQLGDPAKDCSKIKINVDNESNTATIKNEAVVENFYLEENGIITPQDGTNKATVTWDHTDEVLDLVVLNIAPVFAVVSNCRPVDDSRRAISIWQLQKPDTNLTNAMISIINTTLVREFGIQIGHLQLLDHSENACYQLPKIPAGQPVILPLKCKKDTPAVQNFDILKFLGSWHEIASYYSEHVVGTCARAEYTLGDDGIVNVLNNYVVSQGLTTTSGNATVIDENNSGKLRVTLEVTPGENVTRDILIRATDYENYAILYSCDDLPDDKSRVYSWILSKSPSLSESSQRAVNEVINSQLDLNNAYYQETPRTDDDCFYYPEANPGEPVIFRGQCDDVPVMPNFEPNRYLGLWHNIESYASKFQTGTCSNAYYSAEADNGEIGVFNTQVINQTLDTINGIASVPDPEEPAKFVVSFPVEDGFISIDYWVLDTDYETYALVYSCINAENNERYVFSWKLSKTKSLSEEAKQKIDKIIEKVPVLDQKYYEPINQSREGCFYFPDPVPGKPVVFPGQCDEDLAVPSLNLTRFNGTWYEVEAYPIDQRSGHCIHHEYTAGSENTLNLQSEQIEDQNLTIATGTVTADTQNSGRLTISLTNNKGEIVNIPFWIISTDYDNYALAYSCDNRDDDFRNIFSWKLSRTKTLSPEANVAINNAISTIDVLGNDYYESIDQSDEACFYLPHLEPGQPIILPGKCDPNIPVVRDFNLSIFLERWRLIESYPTDFQTGTCNDATYTFLPDGLIHIYNTQVINQTLDTINGSAYLIDNGKLYVEYPGVQPMELWVLDTDYSSYALIYSCIDINENERRVWSWKLGRNTYLSNDSISSIDLVMNGINVLNNRYFQTISHSADDCFYFPVPSDEPVFFRGQCDETIPVVTDFDPEAYAGKWYAIQSYPLEFQYGTCLSALHTFDQATRSFEIYNTQVYLQRLNTMNATAVLDSNGTGKLNVSFPVPGYFYPVDIVTPYWILDTDYDNYALVYSCVNYNDEYMRVGYWRLSRNRTLSPESVDAIENITKDLKILDDRYLITWGHDDNDCFYYPELTDGQVILDGQCEDNNITVVSGFDPSQFEGVWHELERFPSKIQTGDCSGINFVLNTSNKFTVTQNIVYNERLQTYTGPALVASDGSGVITVDLSDDSGASINLNLYVLDTDYEEFALLYSCRNFNENQKQVFSWKLGRYQYPLSPQANERIDAIVTNNTDLYAGYYEHTDQSNDACFYYPRFDELPNYITLPGPCDERIRGVSGFDLNRYTGRWIEIAKYPQPYQFGTCDRAEYALVNGILEVNNTLVANRTLLSQFGSATQSSNDGSGVFDITFVIDDEEIVANYYVLATDYDSYSLVYSCRNLPDGNRQVFSWKLSRTFTLSAQANSIMDQVILDTQGLIEEYYTPTSQSDEDCFYVPPVDTQKAPVFRGQCEDIVGLENFDIEQFLGWWHEIKSYPRDTNPGDCTSSRYDSADDQVEMVDTGIFDVTAEITTGAVRVDSNGRLLRTLSDGQEQEIWVLATDYNEYAVLYSCENIDSERRRVWSAIHSRNRTTQFTEAAQIAIDEVVDNNEVLYPQFYQDIDQSDDACFHYPLQTGQQIILPGQCDQNIPIEQNFSLQMYTGKWYQTERYINTHESGTCIGAEYKLDFEAGLLTIVNWAVINDELVTVEGTIAVTSEDGSAKLVMEIPVEGTEETTKTELYILTTDYASYSLLYTCTNIDEYYRAVGAWKLSRTRTMPGPSSSAINQYMSTRKELYQPYFISVVQYEDCDEPDSSTLIKSSIVVTIICLTIQKLL